MEKMLTRAEVANALRRTPATISRLTKKGQLPKPVRIAGKPLWPADQIEKFVAGGTK